MCLKNSSSLIDKVLKYLRMPLDVNEEIINNVKECIDEIDNTIGFKYIYKKYSQKLDFLKNEPYSSFLKNCEEYYLVAVTLGVEVERKINYYSKVNASKMVILDAAASAILEEKANEFEKTLGDNLTYRFCPGYQKSSIEDIKIINQELKAEKIGIQILDSCMMIPQKSMIGIVGIIK